MNNTTKLKEYKDLLEKITRIKFKIKEICSCLESIETATKIKYDQQLELLLIEVNKELNRMCNKKTKLEMELFGSR